MKRVIALAIAILAPVGLSAQETNGYWGNTHLHTSSSFDVNLFNTPGATPDTAYRFAKGRWS